MTIAGTHKNGFSKNAKEKPRPILHFLNEIPIYYSIPKFKTKAFHLNYAHIHKIIFKV
jgi:hypothetical protein